VKAKPVLNRTVVG